MPMDGIRRADDVVLRFDLPGVDPGSIEVTVDRGVLSVTARREEEFGEDERVFVRERPMGSFTRRVYLSEHLDAGRSRPRTTTASWPSGSRCWSGPSPARSPSSSPATGRRRSRADRRRGRWIRASGGGPLRRPTGPGRPVRKDGMQKERR